MKIKKGSFERHKKCPECGYLFRVWYEDYSDLNKEFCCSKCGLIDRMPTVAARNVYTGNWFEHLFGIAKMEKEESKK